MNKKVDEFNNFLKNKKIAIIGAGVSNIPLIEFLANLSCDITLFDKKELSEDVSLKVKKYNIKTSLGDNYLESLVGFDVIFRSPSCLPSNPYLREEASRGALITTEVSEVIKLAPCKVIGVTGSDGKTTTTTLISLVLSSLGYNVHTGGNIGRPIFTMMNEVNEDDIIVLELSSFQLMGMDCSPNISIITNITPNHLDIHGSYDEYINAKKSIFLNQKKDDVVVLNYDDGLVRGFSREARGEVRYFSKNKKIKDSYVLDGCFIKYNDNVILDTRELKIRGIHNFINICTVLNAVKDYIKDIDEVVKVIREFSGVSHRIEYIRTLNGVKWYNDSASSTPSRTIAGINAFDENIILIAGGYDKNIPYDSLAIPVLDKVRVLILFGNTKDKIYEAVTKEAKKRKKNIEIYMLSSLDEVISKAYDVSKSGEVVLFSPASASFDMFKNAYERGDLFKKKVNNLK